MSRADDPLMLCLSIAARPGSFGATVHNAAFQAIGRQGLYKPIGLQPADLPAFVASLRMLGVRGCGVSMPHKVAILPLLDRLDPQAEAVGAVNTVVNEDGRLTGFNTDVDGIFGALDRVNATTGDHVLVLGAGGLARAVCHALAARSISFTVACRDATKAPSGVEPDTVVPWDQRCAVEASVVINATPIGMQPDLDASPLPDDGLERYRALIDGIASPPQTRLVRAAQGAGLRVADGLVIALAQAARQFALYTGVPAPLDVMAQAMGMHR